MIAAADQFPGLHETNPTWVSVAALIVFAAVIVAKLVLGSDEAEQ